MAGNLKADSDFYLLQCTCLSIDGVSLLESLPAKLLMAYCSKISTETLNTI